MYAENHVTIKKEGDFIMSSYTHFTEEEKEQARNTDLVSFLRHRGETLKRSGSEYEWKSDIGKVTIRGNLWFHQYEREGGDAIGFVQRYGNLTFPEAVSCLLSEQGIVITAQQRVAEQKEKKSFALPKASADMRRMYAYLLKGRFLDREIVDAFVKEKLLYEDGKYHNAVFVGRDEQGVPRHAHKRGTYSESGFKGNVDGSSPEYSFHYIGTGNKLYVFEAPIDMLSYLSMHKEGWQENSYVALCSVAPQAVVHLLKTNPHIDTIVTCLDHDKAGIEGNYRVAEAVRTLGEKFTVKRKSPPYKDWNESLKAGHGIPPIPAEEHPGLVRMKVMCRKLVEDYSEETCSRYPLEELQNRYDKLKKQAKSKKISPEQSYEMAGVAFLFATKQLAAMEKQVSADEMASRLFALYQPHHDNTGIPSRMAQIGETLQELKQAVDNNEILPESGQEKIVRKTMSLAVDCLRLSFVYANLSQRPLGQSQNSERRESPCPVLQQ